MALVESFEAVPVDGGEELGAAARDDAANEFPGHRFVLAKQFQLGQGQAALAAGDLEAVEGLGGQVRGVVESECGAHRS